MSICKWQKRRWDSRQVPLSLLVNWGKFQAFNFFWCLLDFVCAPTFRLTRWCQRPIEIFFYWFRKALVLNMFFCTEHNLSGIPPQILSHQKYSQNVLYQIDANNISCLRWINWEGKIWNHPICHSWSHEFVPPCGECLRMSKCVMLSLFLGSARLIRSESWRLNFQKQNWSSTTENLGCLPQWGSFI